MILDIAFGIVLACIILVLIPVLACLVGALIINIKFIISDFIQEWKSNKK